MPESELLLREEVRRAAAPIYHVLEILCIYRESELHLPPIYHAISVFFLSFFLSVNDAPETML